MQHTLCDLFATKHAGCGWPLANAMVQVAREGSGVIVVLRNHDSAREIVQQMRDFQIHDAEDAVPQRTANGHLRTFGVGAQILSDLGVRKMRLLSAPKSIHAISGFDLEVVEYVDCE
jgi:3,4-dihydroxy 2-butanone 4-phosphate synthase/GTP cyclohydrolase II